MKLNEDNTQKTKGVIPSKHSILQRILDFIRIKGKSEEHCASDAEKGPRFTWDEQKDGPYVNERLGPFILYFDSEKKEEYS